MVAGTFCLAMATMGATCDDGDDSPPLEWYATCGDPVCGGYNPDPALPLCADQMVGEACADDGDSCVVVDDDCNAHLLCTDSDPATMCPISRAEAKRDIAYVDARDRDALTRQLLATRLATYRYRDQDDASMRLGFLIDDQPAGSPAVRPNRQRVDMYGYVSMSVAAIQSQAQQIRTLEAELARVRAELDELQAGVCLP